MRIRYFSALALFLPAILLAQTNTAPEIDKRLLGELPSEQKTPPVIVPQAGMIEFTNKPAVTQEAEPTQPAETQPQPANNPQPTPAENLFSDEKLPAENNENVKEGIKKALASYATGDDIFAEIPIRRSVMFPREKLDTLYQALSGQQVALPSAEQAKTDVQNVIITAPALYINSLIYVDDENWSFWLNGQRYDDGIIPELSVERVSAEFIILAWTPKMLDTISPGWQQKLELVKAEENSNFEGTGFISRDKKIFVGEDAVVHIKLAVNQSFVSRTMQIVEGLREGTTINLNPTELPDGKTTQPKKP